MVEILRISNNNKSGTDLHRHSQLPTPNSILLNKFQFTGAILNSCGRFLFVVSNGSTEHAVIIIAGDIFV